MKVLPVHADDAFPSGAAAGTAEPAAVIKLGAIAVAAGACGCGCGGRGAPASTADPVEVAPADLVETGRAANNANAAEQIPPVHAFCAPAASPPPQPKIIINAE